MSRPDHERGFAFGVSDFHYPQALEDITGMTYPVGAIYTKAQEFGLSRTCFAKTKKT